MRFSLKSPYNVVIKVNIMEMVKLIRVQGGSRILCRGVPRLRFENFACHNEKMGPLRRPIDGAPLGSANEGDPGYSQGFWYCFDFWSTLI